MKKTADGNTIKIKAVEKTANDNTTKITAVQKTVDQHGRSISEVREDVSTVASYAVENITNNRRRIDWNTIRLDGVESRLANVEQRLSSAEYKVKQLDRKISGFMAQSAATTSLVTPMSPGKVSVSVSVGMSGPAQAFAVGIGARLNDTWAGKTSATYDNVTKQAIYGVGIGAEF